MAPSMGEWGKRGHGTQAIMNNNERELLRRIWLEADATPTAFVSIDTEYTPQGVCELGIATRHKHGPSSVRHIIVNGTRALRQKGPKPFQFGSSEEVQDEADLRHLLIDTLACLMAQNEVVVLAGHEVTMELGNLSKFCDWDVPSQVLVLDTLHIWRSWINVPVRGSLEQALEFFDLLKDRTHLHNAGNDAAYTLELLVCKAIQAVECPVRMDKTDPEEHSLNAKRDFLSSQKYHNQPYTPNSGKRSSRRLKREAQQSLGSPRRPPSPESSFEHESVSRRKRKRGNDSLNGMADAQEDYGADSLAKDVEIIDLTGDTPLRPVPAQPGWEVIDLTDSPRRVQPPPLQGPNLGIMLSPNDPSLLEEDQEMEDMPSQDAGGSAESSNFGAASSRLHNVKRRRL